MTYGWRRGAVPAETVAKLGGLGLKGLLVATTIGGSFVLWASVSNDQQCSQSRAQKVIITSSQLVIRYEALKGAMSESFVSEQGPLRIGDHTGLEIPLPNLEL